MRFKLLALSAALSLGTGCSWFGLEQDFRDKGEDYKTASSITIVQVPPEYDTSRIRDVFVIPDVPQQVEFVDEDGEAFDSVVYAGPSGPAGKKQVYVIGEGDEFKTLSLDEVECNPRFFVGNEDKGASSRYNPLYALGWYVEVDPATKRKTRIRRVIDNFDHDELERKSVFYIIKK